MLKKTGYHCGDHGCDPDDAVGRPVHPGREHGGRASGGGPGGAADPELQPAAQVRPGRRRQPRAPSCALWGSIYLERGVVGCTERFSTSSQSRRFSRRTIDRPLAAAGGGGEAEACDTQMQCAFEGRPDQPSSSVPAEMRWRDRLVVSCGGSFPPSFWYNRVTSHSTEWRAPSHRRTKI